MDSAADTHPETFDNHLAFWTTYDNALQFKLSPIAWLAADAKVYYVGCKTNDFAIATAKDWLRGTKATAYGTLFPTWAVPPGQRLLLGTGVIDYGPGGWASDFASRVLRRGAIAYGGDRFLVSVPRGSSAVFYWSNDLSHEDRQAPPNVDPQGSVMTLNQLLRPGPHWEEYGGGQ